MGTPRDAEDAGGTCFDNSDRKVRLALESVASTAIVPAVSQHCELPGVKSAAPQALSGYPALPASLLGDGRRRELAAAEHVEKTEHAALGIEPKSRPGSAQPVASLLAAEKLSEQSTQLDEDPQDAPASARGSFAASASVGSLPLDESHHAEAELAPANAVAEPGAAMGSCSRASASSSPSVSRGRHQDRSGHLRGRCLRSSPPGSRPSSRPGSRHASRSGSREMLRLQSSDKERPLSGSKRASSQSPEMQRPISSETSGARPPLPEGLTKPPLAEDAKATKKKVLFNASLSDYDVVAASAEARGWRVVKSEEKAPQCNVHWIDMSVISDWLPRIEPWMRVNHFPGMNQSLARKTRLAKNMARMQRVFPEAYRFIPPTWVLPDDLGDLERRFAGKGESNVIYIVKPDHLCQGRGIFLTTELERIRKASAEGREKNEAVVVQRYLSRPMLIEGLKFDLRLYFLVCGVLSDGGAIEPRCFLFRDGLVRLCTTAYEVPTAETMGDKCMHLTNYAINKFSKEFQQPDGDDDSAGSKRSLRWFLSWVGEQYGEKERSKLWSKLGSLCVKMLLTVHSTIEAEYTGTFPKDLTGGQMGCRCFEILGVDVMLDCKRKPYLIEVNHLPSFTCDSPLDEDIKSRVVQQTLDISCSNLTSKDKKTYDLLVRERREAGSSSSAVGASGDSPENGATVELMELQSYKDFERVYPPHDGSTKLAAQYEAILQRNREVFRPVQFAARRRSVAAEPEPPPPKAARPPPLPGKGRSSSVAPAPTEQRSRSAPGPPRCANLPRLGRGASPSPRLGRSDSPSPGEAGALAAAGTPSAARVRQRSVPPPTRGFLPVKSIQLCL